MIGEFDFEPVRRILLRAMPDGSIGVGTVRLDDRRTLRTVVVEADNRTKMLGCLVARLGGLAPEEVAVCLADRGTNRVSSGAAVSLANAMKCETTRIICAETVRDLQQRWGMMDLQPSSRHPTIAAVQVLHLVYKTTLARDVAFGEAWSFSSEAVNLRMREVGKRNGQLAARLSSAEYRLDLATR